MNEKDEDFDNLYDKYDASKSVRDYLIWLIQKGEAEILNGKNCRYTRNPFSGESRRDNSELTPEKCFERLKNNSDMYGFKCRYKDKIYNVYFPDSDSWSYDPNYGGLEEFYKQHVTELKENGEYYIPDTGIPRYKASKSGKGFIKISEFGNEYVLADRDKLYLELSGETIWGNEYILTDDKKIVNKNGEQEQFSEVIYSKGGSCGTYRAYTPQNLIGYNDDEIVFIGGNKEIKKFEREDKEHPVTIFSMKHTIGFIDGNKVRLANEEGELNTFEIEEEIKSVEIKKDHVLVNGNIVCCGVEYGESLWSEKKIEPLCKKINNPEAVENCIQKYDYIEQACFIENENGIFVATGLPDEERLKLYKDNGFDELYKKLEPKVLKAREEQQKEEEKRQEERKKIGEYLKGKLLSLCHMRGNKIIELDNARFKDIDDAVILFDKQEKGWAYGPVYETGIINVDEAKKQTRKGKLHLDVPEDAMGIIIGRKGSNINDVTEQLKKKGIDISKIILHPKSREEINITLENIENAKKQSKQQEDPEEPEM